MATQPTSTRPTIATLRENIARLEQALADMTAAKQRAEEERDLYKLDLLFRSDRPYSEQAAACFENRRRLARTIGAFFDLNQEDLDALLAYATEANHGVPDGGYYLRWIFQRLEQRLATIRAAEHH